MTRSLFFVVLIGAGIGFMMPGGRDAAPVAAAADGAAAPIAAETRIRRERNGHFYVHAEVNGELVRFLVDTGATMVALTPEDAERAGVEFNPARFEPVARGASGLVRGQHATIDSVEIDGKRVTNVRGAVIEGADISLLGQSYLSRIGSVEMSEDIMVLR